MLLPGFLYISSIVGLFLLLFNLIAKERSSSKFLLLLIIFSGLLIWSAIFSLSNNIGVYGIDASSEYYVIKKTLMNGHIRNIEDAFTGCLSISLTIPALLLITNMKFIHFYNSINPILILMHVIIFYCITRKLFDRKSLSLIAMIFFLANYALIQFFPAMLRSVLSYIILFNLYLVILGSKNHEKNFILTSVLLSIGVIVSYYSVAVPSTIILLLTSLFKIKEERKNDLLILSITMSAFAFIYLFLYAQAAGVHIVNAFKMLTFSYEERYSTKVSLVEVRYQVEDPLKIIGQNLKIVIFTTNHFLAFLGYLLLIKRKLMLTPHTAFFDLSSAFLLGFLVLLPSSFIWGIINYSYYYHWVIIILASSLIFKAYNLKEKTITILFKTFSLLLVMINLLNTTFITDYMFNLSNSYVVGTILNNDLNPYTMRAPDYYSLVFLVRYLSSNINAILGDAYSIGHVNYIAAEYYPMLDKAAIVTIYYSKLLNNPLIIKGIIIYLSKFDAHKESLYLPEPGYGYGIPFNINSLKISIIYNSGAQILIGY